jgi:raffinose/stachyose/melibiose transport system substrate-binding protein
MSLVALMSILTAVTSSCIIHKSGNSQEATAQRTEVALWHNFTGDDLRALTMRTIIQEFQLSHPDVDLRISAIPPDEYRSRLMKAAEIKQMPDVFVMWSGSMTKQLASRSLIQPINVLVEENPEWRDGFLPNSLEAFTEDGFVYGAPMGLSPTSILYYNKRIFRENNLQVPKTWPELIHVIGHLKEDGITPIAFGNKAAWLAQSSLFSSLADRVTGTEWFLKAVNQDGASFTDPPFIEALSYLKQLCDIGAFSENYAEMDNVQMELAFAKGEAAMMIDGGWALTNLAANASAEEMKELGATVLPSIPEGKGNPNTLAGVVGSGMALGSNSEGKSREAALQLIYAMSGPDAQRRTLESNQLVSYKIALDKSAVSPIFAEVYDLVNSVRLTPVYDGVLTAEGADALNKGIQELLAGGDPRTIAQNVQDAHAKALAKLREHP